MRGYREVLLFSLILAASAVPFNITRLTGETTGAACLDGSPAAYYFRPGSGDGANKWVLGFNGGAWCVSRDGPALTGGCDSCLARSKTALGSSTSYPAQSDGWKGFGSDDPIENPLLYNWNFVVFVYCDGASFSGDAANADVVDGTKLWYRGHRNMLAVLTDLDERGLSDSSDIIVTGASAGGLAAFLHADEIAARYSKAHVVSAPIGGFFLDHRNARGENIWPDAMREAFALHHAILGVPKDCLAVQKAGDEWKCFFAQYVLPTTRTPTFVLNDATDSWQIMSILGSNMTEYTNCSLQGPNDPSCTPEMIAQIEEFRLEMVSLLKTGLHKGSAAWGDSCFKHCAAESYHYDIIKIGQDSMMTAFEKWYKDQTQQSLWVDCALHPTYPFGCNPTC